VDREFELTLHSVEFCLLIARTFFIVICYLLVRILLCIVASLGDIEIRIDKVASHCGLLHTKAFAKVPLITHPLASVYVDGVSYKDVRVTRV
jgi:hypothetical protein